MSTGARRISGYELWRTTASMLMMECSVVGEGHELSLVVISHSSVATTFARMKGNGHTKRLAKAIKLKF
jgi:hypothetical protein